MERVTLEALAEQIFLYTGWHEADGDKSTATRFADTWRRLAGDLLDPVARAEYNSIKHGLRVAPGGFTLSMGVEDHPGVPAPADRMRSFGGSVFGSTFLRSERVGVSPQHIRIRRVSLNWSAEAMVQRLALISMSIANVVGSLQCVLGVEPATVRFLRPDRSELFEEAWRPVGETTMSSIDSTVRLDSEFECSKDELLAELNSRGQES
jgi:hypothetical protein